MLETYRGLDESGRGVHFNTVLTAVESPEVKNLLVRLDEQSHQKKVDPETRLHDFLIAYQRLQHDLLNKLDVLQNQETELQSRLSNPKVYINGNLVKEINQLKRDY